jgi:lipopolysaccharide transport system ATP-binding protein
MSEPVITIDGIGKRYKLGKRERYRALRDTLADLASAPFRALSRRREPPEEAEHLWALRNVTFDVHAGDVLGIIGRNGAGKSTLLKILSRITEPTEGYARIKGRVGSLLEVGTGFHPELSGRENIFLNGAILGMRRAEITRKFDDIVAFAEVERFIDTPVKRYSSGMYVRLAFAVAAHLEPEIMLVDEVLAVGDAAFQKKCLGKMGDVAREGRTVLFVSHNMAAIENLCTRGVVLNRGGVEFAGTQNDAIAHYLRSLADQTTSIRERTDRKGSGDLRVVAIDMKDEQGRLLEFAQSGQTVDVCLHYEARPGVRLSGILASITIKTHFDAPVAMLHNRMTRNDFGVLPERGTFVCRIERLPLPAATYGLGYSIMPNLGRDGSYIDTLADAFDLDVIAGDFYGSGEIPPISHGVSLMDGEWRMISE